MSGKRIQLKKLSPHYFVADYFIELIIPLYGILNFCQDTLLWYI